MYDEARERVLESNRLKNYLELHIDNAVAVVAFLMDTVWTTEQGVYSYEVGQHDVLWMGEYEISLQGGQWIFENIIKSAPTHCYSDLLEGLKTEFIIARQVK